VHALGNYAALGVYGMSYLARRRGRHARGKVLALAGAGLLAATGYLGGHLSYAYGVGVDTTAFQGSPDDWTDVAADADVQEGKATLVEVAGTPVLLSRVSDRVIAIFDRCTHRGGPLHEGRIDGDCVECPWHGSRFRLVDGEVERGPAQLPQPRLEVRLDNGRVLVRRTEERALRSNPVH
jgi:nitrite reductase/ring-hydroxylating ferredoxin subunit